MRTRQKGIEGFVASCFVGAMPPLKTGKCNRPDPIGTLTQFEHLSDTLQGFIEAEHFSDADWKDISREDTEKLAAKCYFAAYATAGGRAGLKQRFRVVIGNQIYGSDFSKLPPSEQVSIQVWLQKLLDVLSKAFDLGYKDGAKLHAIQNSPSGLAAAERARKFRCAKSQATKVSGLRRSPLTSIVAG